MPINNRQFGRAKELISRDVLLPVGFRKLGSLYVRSMDEQFHGIDFQASRHGDGYFVNLAFHYSFLPGFLHPKKFPPGELHILDFLSNARLSSFLLSNQKAEPTLYSETLDEAVNVLTNRARASVGVLDEYGRQWKEPSVWLNMFPLEVFEQVISDTEHRMAMTREYNLHPLTKETRNLIGEIIGPEWTVGAFKIGYLLCAICLRQHNEAAAEKYLELTRRIVTDDPASASNRKRLEGIGRDLTGNHRKPGTGGTGTG
jgi:hypothetical protein